MKFIEWLRITNYEPDIDIMIISYILHLSIFFGVCTIVWVASWEIDDMFFRRLFVICIHTLIIYGMYNRDKKSN